MLTPSPPSPPGTGRLDKSATWVRVHDPSKEGSIEVTGEVVSQESDAGEGRRHRAKGGCTKGGELVHRRCLSKSLSRGPWACGRADMSNQC